MSKKNRISKNHLFLSVLFIVSNTVYFFKYLPFFFFWILINCTISEHKLLLS